MTGAKAYAQLSPETVALMKAKGTDQNAPMLIRAYKKEAELEIWKQKKDGTYVQFKTYPMCRWSGQLGPKRTEGDRQVPEGFYTITPGQMNPNSHYYLSFNVGYPNAYDRAHGYQGGNIMVHGICSSAGCFSMTDKQIEEIYAVARESFAGGQRQIQMQSFPFHMTADNMAKLRLDPNMPFWKELKRGADYFEVTKQETPVGVCAKHYVFGATPKTGRFDALSPCPALNTNSETEAAIAIYKWDVGSFDACAAGLKQVEADLGPIDVLVNNAGITRDTTFHRMTPDQWSAVINTNLNSLFNMCRPVIEGMRDRNWGRIINISSINGQKGQMGQTNYSAAKAGVIGFTKALAQETASKGITVNAVAPGYIDTDMMSGIPEKVLAGIVGAIPVGRLGHADEIAACVAFLAREDAAFITGATITANGGQHYV